MCLGTTVVAAEGMGTGTPSEGPAGAAFEAAATNSCSEAAGALEVRLPIQLPRATAACILHAQASPFRRVGDSDAITSALKLVELARRTN